MTKCLLGLALTTIAVASVDGWADDNTDPNARDLLILTQWFEGDFDNEEQLWFQADPRSATPDDERHVQIHTSHRRLQLPAFGEHVFYVEEYKDNDPTDIIRQRFVTFASEPEQGRIRMKQGFFKDPEAARGAHRDPGKLGGIGAEDVFFLDGCDVFWQRRADQYEGAMAPQACAFGEGDARRYSVHNLTLSATKYWRVDTTFRFSDGELHAGMPVDQPFRLRRAQQFLCEVNIRGDDPKQYRDLELHSQGGEVTFEGPNGKSLILRMRDKEYPYYATRPDFLFFSLREAGEVRSIVYSVHDRLSRRLGFNLDWIGAHCHRAGYDFREPLSTLPPKVFE